MEFKDDDVNIEVGKIYMYGSLPIFITKIFMCDAGPGISEYEVVQFYFLQNPDKLCEKVPYIIKNRLKLLS